MNKNIKEKIIIVIIISLFALVALVAVNKSKNIDYFPESKGNVEKEQPREWPVEVSDKG